MLFNRNGSPVSFLERSLLFSCTCTNSGNIQDDSLEMQIVERIGSLKTVIGVWADCDLSLTESRGSPFSENICHDKNVGYVWMR